MGEFVALFPAVVALCWIVFATVYVVRREWRLPHDIDFTPSLAIVVPACNEELVIAATIEALLRQGYPGLEIHVVSDGSVDRTAAIARGYVEHGVRVHELAVNVGKSRAVQYVLDRIGTDLFMIVDADTRCRSNAIGMLVQQFADPGVGGATGNVRVGNVESLLTAVQAMEYSVIVGLAKRAEQSWGGLYTVSGAAACFRTTALRAVGGFGVATVTEDIEISWRLQRSGWRLAYDPRALFYIQTPVRLRALLRQRRRWSMGMVEVIRLHWNVAATPVRALIPITAQVVGAATWMLVATALLVDIAARATASVVGSGQLDLALGSGWPVLFLWTIGLFGVQALVASVFDGAHVAGGWRVLPLFVLFPVYFWLIVYPSFIAGALRGLVSSGETMWSRTERTLVDDHGEIEPVASRDRRERTDRVLVRQR